MNENKNKQKRIETLLQLKKMAENNAANHYVQLQAQIKHAQQQAEDLGSYGKLRHDCVLSENKTPVSSIVLQEHQRFSKQVDQALVQQQRNLTDLHLRAQQSLNRLKVQQAEKTVVDNLQKRLAEQALLNQRTKERKTLDSNSILHAIHRQKE